jgi:hypothetical protein
MVAALCQHDMGHLANQSVIVWPTHNSKMAARVSFGKSVGVILEPSAVSLGHGTVDLLDHAGRW